MPIKKVPNYLTWNGELLSLNSPSWIWGYTNTPKPVRTYSHRNKARSKNRGTYGKR
jgi:hypothetical protein